MTCINPDEITEGDLMAFIDGDATPAVAAHLHACTACRQQVAHLRTLHSQLRVVLDRRTCPAPELLGELAANLLTGGQKLVVARHIQQCPACAQELARYSQPLLPPTSAGASDWLPTIIRRVTAALRWTPSPSLAFARGAGQPPQAFFQAGDLGLLIGDAAAAGAGGQLIGVLLPQPPPAALPSALPPAKITLVRGDTPVAETVSDGLGHFVIEQASPGTYDLLVHWQDELVWIDAITVAPRVH